MLTIAKISSQGVSYYGRDNYYTKGEEDAGQWYGKGAEQLGLVGGVDNDKFQEMIKGKFDDITLGKSLGDGTKQHHPGWDHTFSAPKSVSLLALVGKDSRLIAAHDEAVNYTLNYIEKNLAETRVRMSSEWVDNQKTGNIVAAKFRHDISRDKDPQLHTHAPILNATLDANGNLRSLDSPILYEHKMLGGALYQSKLANLVKELGYEIQINDNGTFDIVGIDREIIDRGSKARNRIQNDMDEKGTSGAIAAQHSSLATRPHKDELSYQEKQELWSYDFKDDLKTIDDVINKSFNNELTIDNKQHLLSKNQNKEAKKAVDSAIKHLSENEAVFKTIDIKREALVSALGKVDEATIDKAIANKWEKGELLKANINEIKLSNGYPINKEKEAFTTPELLQKEQQTLKIMREGNSQVESIIDSNTRLKRESIFTQGQKNAATKILTTNNRFINIQGFAGTGKTFMLEEVKEQAEQSNYKIVGLAPSGAAANVLQKETGIDSQTVQKFLKQGLRDLNKPKEVKQEKQKELWVIDESSFISTTQANALVKIATRENAQVVLIGDNKQLAGVEAGKPFAISQDPKHNITTTVMDEIIRQKDIELKQAVYSATKGDIKEAFAKIDKDIQEVKDKQDNDDPIKRRELIVKEFLQDVKNGKNNVIVISPSNEERTNTNTDIRKGLIDLAVLKGEGITTTNLVNKNLTTEARTKSFNYQTDNIVRFNRNYKSLNIAENSYYTVKDIDHDTNTLTLKNQANNQEIQWNPKKLGSKGTEVYFENTREIKEGEELFWRRAGGDKNHSRRTNEKIKVLSVDNKSNTIKYTDTNTGTIASMNLKEFNNKHWEYAYCLTAHQSQGQTADKVIINLESWRSKLANQQAFYVEISRAKYQAKIFTDDKEQIQRQLTTNTGEKQSSLEQTTDERTKFFDERLNALKENNINVKAIDLIRSKELQQQADMLSITEKLNIDYQQLGIDINNPAKVKDFIYAISAITGNKELVRNEISEDIKDIATEQGNTFLTQELEENKFINLLTSLGEKGGVILPSQYQELNKHAEILNKNGKECDVFDVMNSKELKQKADNLFLEEDVTKNFAIITGNTNLPTNGSYQDHIDEAHKFFKENLGEKHYKEMLQDANREYSIELSTEMLPQKPSYEDYLYEQAQKDNMHKEDIQSNTQQEISR